MIVFSLQKSQIDVSFEERNDAFRSRLQPLCRFCRRVQWQDHGSSPQLHTKRTSISHPRLGKVSSREAEKVFAAAIESSIQQLAGNAVALLAQWAEEPSPKQ